MLMWRMRRLTRHAKTQNPPRTVERARAGFMFGRFLLQNLISSNDADEDDDDGEHEKDVDEASERVRRDEAKKPQDHENDGDSPKHISNLLE